MKEGEPVLGGPQANPGATNVPNPGTQPASPSVPQYTAPAPTQFPTQPTPQPISTGTGDIILSDFSSPKTKKTPIIILIILLIIAIVGIGAYFLIPSQNNTSQSQNNSTLTQAFYTYANRLLFGEEKSEPVSDFDVENFFYIDENFGDTNYLNSLLNDYNNFLAQAESSNNLKDLPIQNIKNQIEFLIQYDELGFIDNNVVLDMYYSEGPEAAKALVEEYYIVYDTDSDLIKTIKDYEKQVALNKILILSDEGSSTVTEEIMNNIYNIVTTSIQELKDTCKNINLIINGNNNE